MTSAFLQAVQERDGSGLMASFTDGALVVEDGAQYRGGAIEEWNDRMQQRSNRAEHLVNVARSGDRIVLRIMEEECPIGFGRIRLVVRARIQQDPRACYLTRRGPASVVNDVIDSAARALAIAQLGDPYGQ